MHSVICMIQKFCEQYFKKKKSQVPTTHVSWHHDNTLFLRFLVMYSKDLAKNDTNATKKMSQNLPNVTTIYKNFQFSN